MNFSKRTKAIFAAVGVYTIWGFTFLASKIAQDSVTPFVLLAWRFDVALLILSIPLIIGKQKLRFKGKNIKPLLLLGAMEPCIYFIGEQYGLRWTNSAFSGVMIAVIPIVSMLMAAAFLKEKPSQEQWMFSLLSIAGIIVITLSENSGGEIRFLGVAFLVIAVLSGAGYGVISRSCSDEFSVYERSWAMQCMGAVFFTVLALIENANDPSVILTAATAKGFIPSVLYLAVGATVVGYLLFNYAVANAPMANVVSLCNLTTVLSVIAGLFILDEAFSVLSLIAMFAVVVGIFGVQKYSADTEQPK